MLNYINELSIYGLMNKNAFINYDADVLSFYKTKNKKKVVFFNKLTEEEESKYEQINYMYLDEDPNDKRAFSMEQIVSIINDDMFVSMPGKAYREIRETVNKDTLKAKGMVGKVVDGIKILGNGDLTKKLTVEVSKVSASAKAKIEKAGGSVKVLADSEKKSAE